MITYANFKCTIASLFFIVICDLLHLSRLIFFFVNFFFFFFFVYHKSFSCYFFPVLLFNYTPHYALYLSINGIKTFTWTACYRPCRKEGACIHTQFHDHKVTVHAVPSSQGYRHLFVHGALLFAWLGWVCTIKALAACCFFLGLIIINPRKKNPLQLISCRGFFN